MSTPATRLAPRPATSRVDGVRLVAAMVALMWVVEAIDALDHHGLDRYGIAPHHLAGLRGIVLAPFLHAGWGHLIGNTVPFAVLGGVIALSGALRVATVTALVAIVSGAGVWLIAPDNTITIGASGLVFGYAAYLISRGIFDRNLLELAVGAIVLAVWGGSLWFSLLPHPGVSWQGHLFGAVGGVIAARVLARAPRSDVQRPAGAR